jgi:asparagine synthase (glutamine-hydrolysing)
MCGITGVISNNATTKAKREENVLKMNSEIYHRGPDDDGFFSDDLCTLAMRRLSIIDLHTGKQPLYSADKRYLIFFNGEIYNYKILSAELSTKGVNLYTQSDTEVIVNLFSFYGKKMLNMLHGMFAFCIYDLVEKKFFFARDRFGEKPFFYYHKGQNLAFSSELPALLKCDLIKPVLNRTRLNQYLALGYLKEPETLLKDIYTIPPGFYMEFDQNTGIHTEAYFYVTYQPDRSIKTLSDASNFIKPYFEQAVEKQLVSDVPIGAFLSGGIDSSSIVAVMKKYAKEPFQTFTVRFKNTAYDESPIAREVATKIGTIHNEIIVENNGFTEGHFWHILKHVGHPFPDSSAIPTDLVTKEIAKHVKVALSGDGGDEVFGGYTLFDWIPRIAKAKSIPAWLNNFLQNAIGTINSKLIDNNQLRQLGKMLEISKLPIDKIIQETQALFSSNELLNLSKQQDQISKFSEYDESCSILRNTMLYRVKYDLPLDMLIKVDRMSMANSLEVRSPFLDPVLFEASCKLPDEFLRNKGLGKLVIREMMKDALPSSVFNHPKSGFSIPLHEFKNDEFKRLAIDLLNQPFMYELFHKTELDKIIKLGLESNKDTYRGSIYRVTHQLWSLMMLSGWIKLYRVKVE